MTDDVPNPSSKNRTVCWLIEHQNGGWLHGNPEHEDGFGWSPDPNRAIRFCRQIDAEWTMARLGFSNPLHFASEHVFISDDSPPAHETVPKYNEAERAEAWVEVCKTLTFHNKEWFLESGTGVECALREIKRLQALDTSAQETSGWGGVEKLCQQRNDALAEVEQLRDALDFILRERITLHDGAFFQRAEANHPDPRCGWYSFPSMPDPVSATLHRARERFTQKASPGLSEHAAGTGAGNAHAEARLSRREVTAQSWPKYEEPGCDNPADPHEIFCRDHK